MIEFLKTWRYWYKRGHSLRYAWHLARNTITPSKPRRKRGFFFSRFPTFWTKP